MDIIDIACGTGNYADYFKQFKPQSLTLIDASEGMLDEAKAKLMSPLKKPRLSFKKAILPEIPYEDNSFDAGMINMVSALSEKKIIMKLFIQIEILCVFIKLFMQ